MISRHVITSVVGLLLLAGCTRLSNRSMAVAKIASLPSGDEVVCRQSSSRAHPGGPVNSGPREIIWNKPGQTPKLMSVTGLDALDGKAIERAQVHANDDRSRIWLTDGNRTIATFDYQTGAAVFGETAQP